MYVVIMITFPIFTPKYGMIRKVGRISTSELEVVRITSEYLPTVHIVRALEERFQDLFQS